MTGRVDWHELLDMRRARRELGFSQSEMADMLGISVRTVQSTEQGWRQPSSALEKSILLLLLATRNGLDFGARKCWDVRGCGNCSECVVRRSHQGHLCWFLTGNICGGRRMRSWRDKKTLCGECEFLHGLLSPGDPTTVADVNE